LLVAGQNTANQNVVGQKTKVLKYSNSAFRRSRIVSGPGMSITKVCVLQNESEAHSFKVKNFSCVALMLSELDAKALKMLLHKQPEKGYRHFLQ